MFPKNDSGGQSVYNLFSLKLLKPVEMLFLEYLRWLVYFELIAYSELPIYYFTEQM